MKNDESVSVENQLLKSQTAALEQLLEVYEKSVMEKTDELYAEIAKRRQAEEMLIRIQKAVESSGEAIGMSDPRGSHFYQNKAFFDMFEYSVEELNKPLAPIAVYADPEVGREVFETIIQGNPWMGETIMVAKGGRRFPVFLRADAVKDDTGNIIGLIGIHTDITERRQAEEELKEKDQFMKSIVQSSAVATFVVNPEHKVIYWNKACEDLTGIKSEDLLGTSDHWKAFYDHPRPCIADIVIDNKINEMSNLYPVYTRSVLIPGGIHAEGWYPNLGGKNKYIVFDAAPIRDSHERISAAIETLRDITARKRSEEALHTSQLQLLEAMDLAHIVYWEFDPVAQTYIFNDPFYAFYGTNAEQEGGYLVSREDYAKRFIHPDDIQLYYQFVKENALRLDTESFADLEHRIARRNGEVRYILARARVIKDDSGRIIKRYGVNQDITERKCAVEEIQYLATHDSLTGLPNRAMFSQLLNHAIQAAQRYHRQFAVLFIDLDRFKIINDTLGHKAGDQLLQEIATRLKQPLRAVDVVARLGGDEFVILIEEVSDSSQVATVAHKILTSIIKPVTLMGQECRITASVGICMYPKDAEDEQSLMKNADIAMYFAKEEGKNNYQFYSEDIQSKSLEHLSIETNLRFALERNELSLHYQAKVDFKTNAITGVEALLRWQNPYLGSITPTQFIPVAEETGLIVPIGKWVLKTACAQNIAWQKQGLPAVCMAINLSLRQLTDDNLIDDIKTALNDSGMAPNLLELEITESMVMYNPARMVSILGKIKSMGVRLAIDDFGTGYASLAHIKRFPVDTLKVDRSFIRNIPQDAEDRAITEAIIAMGKALSLTVVAEGVETEEQMNFLKEHSCDEMQGFYFSKPIMPEQFADLLREHVSSPRK
jgi:diguanylate cyclase (GGDEF)-like protein/PAS domain S-box-containing protein